MQKTYEFKGQFTTLHEEDNCDIFYNITNILMRGFTFEFHDKPNVDFMISMRNQAFVVTTNLRPVFSAKMKSCEKKLAETLFNKEKALKDFDIDPDEWIAVLKSDEKLQKMQEPMKRVFELEMKITNPDDNSDECRKFFETGMELLNNIQ